MATNLPLSPPPSRSSSTRSLHKLASSSPPPPPLPQQHHELTPISPTSSSPSTYYSARTPLRVAPPPLDISLSLESASPTGLRSFFSPCSSDSDSYDSDSDLDDDDDDDDFFDCMRSPQLPPLSSRPTQRRMPWSSREPPTPPPQTPLPCLSKFTPSTRKSSATACLTPTFGTPPSLPPPRPSSLSSSSPMASPTSPQHTLSTLLSAAPPSFTRTRDRLLVQTQKAHLRRSPAEKIAQLHAELRAAETALLDALETEARERLRAIEKVRLEWVGGSGWDSDSDSEDDDDDDDEADEEYEEDEDEDVVVVRSPTKRSPTKPTAPPLELTIPVDIRPTRPVLVRASTVPSTATTTTTTKITTTPQRSATPPPRPSSVPPPLNLPCLAPAPPSRVGTPQPIKRVLRNMSPHSRVKELRRAFEALQTEGDCESEKDGVSVVVEGVRLGMI